MLTQATLKPGQNGTKRLVKRYGKQLVCVRYRYDPQAGKRYKTVELIIAESEWTPRRSPSERVRIRVGYHEQGLRERVKAAGGRWDKQRKLWELPYGAVAAMKLEGRIAEG
jgi:hypothetical protein